MPVITARAGATGVLRDEGRLESTCGPGSFMAPNSGLRLLQLHQLAVNAAAYNTRKALDSEVWRMGTDRLVACLPIAPIPHTAHGVCHSTATGSCTFSPVVVPAGIGPAIDVIDTTLAGQQQQPASRTAWSLGSTQMACQMSRHRPTPPPYPLQPLGCLPALEGMACGLWTH